MRRITLWFMSTVTALVLLFSYHTSTNSEAAGKTTVLTPKATTTAPTAQSSPSPSTIPDSVTTPEGGSNSNESTPSASTPSSSAPATTSTASGTLKDGTYTGTSADTRWGPVQVQIVVSGGKITSNDAVVYPTENGRDVEINNVAIPALNQEAVTAQSAAIDMISGATYTSDGYITSLQSALDQAAA
jgi:uncharacterized protein with FMN-binding domain